MSFHFYLYRARPGLGPMHEWDAQQAEPLGSADAVRDALAALYPQIAWTRTGTGWSGLGRSSPPYLDVMVDEELPGQCHWIVFNKAPPSVMCTVMEAMALNYVYAPESGDLVDPWAYGDDDPCYVPA